MIRKMSYIFQKIIFIMMVIQHYIEVFSELMNVEWNFVQIAIKKGEKVIYYVN